MSTDARQVPLILDMVHFNPGEPRFETSFADPQKTKSLGFNGKVYFLFDAPTLAVNWDLVDPDIMPQNSPDRKWVDETAARIRSEEAACKALGLQVYAMSDQIVLPKRLVEKFGMQKTFGDPRDAKTEKFLRLMISVAFDQFPDLDGLVIRIGETYLHDAPYHVGSVKNPKNADNTIIPLINILRDEICVKRNKRLIFRTWDSFDTNLDTYLKICNAVEPHPKLIFSVKYCEGDFHRGSPFSKIIGQGRQPQIIEVQCGREYEGKGAYPNYIANGVIDGFEENRLRMPAQDLKSIGEFARTSSLFAGIWTWSRGGGWQGPYIKNELWLDLNAWVMAQWATDVKQSEESVFDRYATEILKLKGADVSKFRKLALLSADAVVRGQVSTMGDISPWWTRDDGLMRATLPTDPAKLKRVIDQKDDAVEIWEQILALARQIDFPDAKTKDYVVISSEYGLDLYSITQAVFHLELIGPTGDAAELKKWLARYDQAWAAYRALPAQSDQCATLYKEGKALKTNLDGIDQVVAPLRKVASQRN